MCRHGPRIFWETIQNGHITNTSLLHAGRRRWIWFPWVSWVLPDDVQEAERHGHRERAEGDVQGVQQGRRGLHHCGGAQVCLDPPARKGDQFDIDHDSLWATESERLGGPMRCFTAQVTYKEIDEMIRTVDKNGDGKINYSEFRVMMGAHPLIMPGQFWIGIKSDKKWSWKGNMCKKRASEEKWNERGNSNLNFYAISALSLEQQAAMHWADCGLWEGFMPLFVALSKKLVLKASSKIMQLYNLWQVLGLT